MNLYVDSSVLLRVVLGEQGRLRDWVRMRSAIASELIRLECLRTVDRARIRLGLRDDVIATHRRDIYEALGAFSLVSLDAGVLERASAPFPTLVGTLDAIHLASALSAREVVPDLAFATHDEELGLAARSVGFRVLGTG
jgi:predicted nucleic acid-binding protein